MHQSHSTSSKGTNHRPKISCIICAYNEAARIGNVLSVVSTFKDFDEVIVVDDGSSDDTFAVASKFPVTVLKHVKNKGKAAAMFTGFQKSRGDIIVLLDSDLVGLTHANLQALLEPTLSEKCAAFVLVANTWPIFHFEGVDAWTGERAFPRKILEDVFLNPHVVQQKYSIECYINQAILKNKLPIYSISWKNVINVQKKDKEEGNLVGRIKDLKMFWNVYSSFGFAPTLLQQIKIPRVARTYRNHI